VRIPGDLGPVEDCQGRVVLLVGEEGIRWSRLARSALAGARANAATTLSGRSLEQLPFTEPLQSALGAAPAHILVVARRRWSELALLVPEFDRESPVTIAGSGACTK